MVKLRESTELLLAFRNGDRAALKEVYDEYSKHLFSMLKEGFAIESSGNRYRFEGYREPWHLETAAQEIFTRAFSPNARNAFDGLRPYKNYLFTIARNYIVDQYKKNRRSFIPLEDIPETRLEDFAEPSSPRSDPEETVATRELQALVQQFVTALTPLEKQLFDLRFSKGLSVEVSAQTAEITDYRVKRTTRKIRKKFPKILDNLFKI